MKSTHKQRITQFCTIAVCCFAVVDARSQCATELGIESRDEYYFYHSDLISSIELNPVLLPLTPFLQPVVGFVESLQTGCPTINIFGVKASGDLDHSFEIDFATTLKGTGGAALVFGTGGAAKQFAEGGFSVNRVNQILTPTFVPCDRVPYETIVHFGGSASLYVAHAGNGPYRKKIAKAMFHTCRDVVIDNASTGTIELPIKIQGSVFAAGSFAIDTNTFGHAKLRAWGSIGGQAFDETIEVQAADIIPEERSINIVRRFTVAPGQGRYTVHIDVNGESLTEVQAKGGGLFGLITASATAGVDFPNSIEIGRFIGTDGSPLPAGVQIYDASDPDSFYENTVPVIAVTPQTFSTLPLRIYAPTGSVYELQASTNLYSWIPLLTINPSTNWFDYVVTNAQQFPQRFFRVFKP